MASPTAIAADYADALISTRRAKNWLLVLLLLILLAQLAIFIIARFGRVDLAAAPRARPMIEYFLSLTTFAGMVLVIVLALVLLLLANIMLVGRLIGLSGVLRAFIACLILAALLFPWQVFITAAAPATPATDFRIPGVLYTWSELAAYLQIHRANPARKVELADVILKYSRFIAFPLIAMVLLLFVQGQSRKGLRQALGEAPIPNPDDLPSEQGH